MKAKTRVAALEVEAAFLKEKQALKMAEEQLEFKKSLAKAKEEERIYEQMNNEELVSTPTCLHAQRRPIFPVSSPLPDNISKNANITSLSTAGSVVTTTAPEMVTRSHLSMPFQFWNLLKVFSSTLLWQSCLRAPGTLTS